MPSGSTRSLWIRRRSKARSSSHSGAQRLREAFCQEFGVRSSVWTVRGILRLLGLTPPRPKRRATQYKPREVQQWKDAAFPRIAQRARE